MKSPYHTDTELDLTPLTNSEARFFLYHKLFCLTCKRQFDIGNLQPNTCVMCGSDLAVVWLVNLVNDKKPGSLLALLKTE